jgi:hypothetical protein
MPSCIWVKDLVVLFCEYLSFHEICVVLRSSQITYAQKETIWHYALKRDHPRVHHIAKILGESAATSYLAHVKDHLQVDAHIKIAIEDMDFYLKQKRKGQEDLKKLTNAVHHYVRAFCQGKVECLAMAIIGEAYVNHFRAIDYFRLLRNHLSESNLEQNRQRFAVLLETGRDIGLDAKTWLHFCKLDIVHNRAFDGLRLGCQYKCVSLEKFEELINFSFLHISPKFQSYLYYLLGVRYHVDRRWPEAKNKLEQALLSFDASIPFLSFSKAEILKWLMWTHHRLKNVNESKEFIVMAKNELKHLHADQKIHGDTLMCEISARAIDIYILADEYLEATQEFEKLELLLPLDRHFENDWKMCSYVTGACIYLVRKEFSKLDKLLERMPQDHNWNGFRVIRCVQKKDYIGAIENGITLPLTVGSTTRYLARAYLQWNNFCTAKSLLQVYLQANRDANILLEMALFHALLGMKTQALTFLKESESMMNIHAVAFDYDDTLDQVRKLILE